MTDNFAKQIVQMAKNVQKLNSQSMLWSAGLFTEQVQWSFRTLNQSECKGKINPTYESVVDIFQEGQL